MQLSSKVRPSSSTAAASGVTLNHCIQKKALNRFKKLPFKNVQEKMKWPDLEIKWLRAFYLEIVIDAFWGNFLGSNDDHLEILDVSRAIGMIVCIVEIY